jgi:hypothetical protein
MCESDLYAAIDRVTKKIEQQIRKRTASSRRTSTRTPPLQTHAAGSRLKMILRARKFLPVTAPPIENGAVFIDGNKIRAVGRGRICNRTGGRKSFRPRRSHTAARPRQRPLPSRLHRHGRANCRRQKLSPTGFRSSPPPKPTGAIPTTRTPGCTARTCLLKTGTTTVADIEAMPDLLPEVWDATPLRVFSFLEMTGIRARATRRKFCARPWKKLIRSRTRAVPRAFAARALLHPARTAAPDRRTARKKKWRVSTHIAESEQEFEMFAHARGDMHDWLKRNERDNSDCGLGSPVETFRPPQGCSAKISSPSTSTCLARGDAKLCSAKTKPTSSIARAATIIFGIRRFARTPRQRRRQPLPRHRQPRHHAQNRKTKTRTEYVRRNALLAASDKNFARGNSCKWPPSTARAPSAWPENRRTFRRKRRFDCNSIPGKIARTFMKRCWPIRAMSPPA